MLAVHLGAQHSAAVQQQRAGGVPCRCLRAVSALRVGPCAHTGTQGAMYAIICTWTADWGVLEAQLPNELRGTSPRSSRAAASAALRRYTGPSAFAIPGNHDWIDGLEVSDTIYRAFLSL